MKLRMLVVFVLMFMMTAACTNGGKGVEKVSDEGGSVQQPAAPPAAGGVEIDFTGSYQVKVLSPKLVCDGEDVPIAGVENDVANYLCIKQLGDKVSIVKCEMVGQDVAVGTDVGDPGFWGDATGVVTGNNFQLNASAAYMVENCNGSIGGAVTGNLVGDRLDGTIQIAMNLNEGCQAISWRNCTTSAAYSGSRITLSTVIDMSIYKGSLASKKDMINVLVDLKKATLRAIEK